MQFSVTEVEFDFDDGIKLDDSKLTFDEEIEIRDLTLGVWEANDEDDLDDTVDHDDLDEMTGMHATSTPAPAKKGRKPRKDKGEPKSGKRKRVTRKYISDDDDDDDDDDDM